LGEPTPDPALLTPNNGNPINLSWDIPLGEPTPDPALLTPNNGNPINLSWDIPLGEPTPDPALLTPNNGNPINLSWDIPLGEPTPDPALLTPNNGNPINLSWDIPLGEPTPDPALLTPNNGNPINLSWDIPLGEPTPDPALLSPNNGNPINLSWDIPLGEPTPDPAQLTAPYPRPLEFGTTSPSAPLTAKPTRMPTPQPVPKLTLSPSPAPTKPKTLAPVKPPTRQPTAPPTRQPTAPPTPLPTVPPTPQPVQPPPPLPVPPPPVPLLYIPVPVPEAKDSFPGSGPWPGTAIVWVSNRNGAPTWYAGGGGNTTASPVPLVIPHNQIFLEGCNPLNCTLNEAADFHSMSNEDESIYELFYTNPIKCCRVIVEVGAGDGDRFAFSHFFEQGLNWRSLLIEANPDVYQELKANRPKATTINGAFCESNHLGYSNGAFSSLGGSVEISSEVHSPPKAGAELTEIPCLSMESVFSENGITKVDVMVVRLQGDALAYIRAMDWTVRVDIWVILLHGATKADRDDLVRKVLTGNEYVQAEWDIKRWCSENETCLNNEVFLRKGFNPLPCEIQETMTAAGARPARNLRGQT
jgi:hypothetical protein